MENLIYLVLAIVWVILQIATRNARRTRSAPPRQTPDEEAGESFPRAPAADPGEELRRFLRELSGQPAETPPPLPPKGEPPPVGAPPSAVPSSASPPRRRSRRQRIETAVEPASVVSAPVSAAVAAEPPQASEPVVVSAPPVAAPQFSFRMMSLPAVPSAASRTVGAISSSAAVGAGARRRIRLPMGRADIRRGILYQVVLGPPRALQPYGTQETFA